NALGMSSGGGRGIRTPAPVSRRVVFKTTAFAHSAIPPRRSRPILFGNSRGHGHCWVGVPVTWTSYTCLQSSDFAQAFGAFRLTVRSVTRRDVVIVCWRNALS